MTREVDDPLLIYGERDLEKKAFTTFFVRLHSFLGALEKMRRATLSFVMSECPSVCMEQLGSQWRDFYDT
jgi:hypothetical protein